MDKALNPYVLDLLDSYRRVGGLNNQDAHNTPSKRAVGQICEDLLQLLFPGFHDEDSIQHDSLLDLTNERMGRAVARLEEQVRKSVRIGDPKRPTGRTPPIMQKFGKSLPEVREVLRTDIEAAFDGDPAALGHEEIILSYPFIEAIAIQRLAHRLHLFGAPVIPRYPNSTILGGKTVIGKNSTIGANVFLMRSVPPNSLVVYEANQLSVLDKTAKNKTAALEWSI